MTTRRQLLRWAGWFSAANALLFALIGLRYLAAYPFEWDALGTVYGILAWVGHFALLAALPVGVIVVPLILLIPRRALVTVIAVLLAGSSLALLIVDTNIFAEQRYHLTPLTAMLFEPATWGLVAVIAAFALLFEGLLSGYVWRWVGGGVNRHGRVLATVLCGGWLASQVIHMWADAVGHTPVTQLTRYLPAYFPIHAKRTLARLGLVDQAVIDRQRLLRRAGAAAAGQLAYPRQPLRCDASTPAPNILFVLIDALRPDAIDPRLLPNLAGLAARGAEFANHWSGGNSSRAGIFSLFYGLPSTYHEPFYGVQQPPVLVTHARESGYQLALFAAPGFSTPTDIERTVFAGTGGLPGERHDIGAIARNRAVTDDWLEWLRKRDRNRAFFGFLYYDPPMGEMSAEGGEALPLDERFAGNEVTRSAWRRYRLAARLVDSELGRVLDSLEDGQLMEHTIIVVASDHGYEFDDNGLGYMGHASNYSAAQLRATLVMHWPGRAPRRYTHRSSHFDVPVTLMQDAFGCRNDPADYAVGRNLYDGQDWEWLIAGSYNSHAIVEPGGVIVTHPGGFVEMLGPDYRPVRGGDFDAAVVARAMNDMRRFYR